MCFTLFIYQIVMLKFNLFFEKKTTIYIILKINIFIQILVLYSNILFLLILIIMLFNLLLFDENTIGHNSIFLKNLL